MKKIFLSLFALFTLSLTIVFAGYANPDTYETEGRGVVSILFVGNSFVFAGDIPGQLQALAGAHGIEITYTDISAGGATLRNLRNNAIREMRNRRFDYVVLQDQSRRPHVDTNGFLYDIRVLSNAARENGAMPVLYNPAVSDQPDEELQNILSEVYRRAARENDAILINAGDASIYAYNTIPGLLLSKSGNQAFLAACVFAAILFDLHITDIPQGSRYTGHNAIALAQAAWNFVNSSR